jgi:tRNA threonylcarbamoyladenosine biosynthesis protein TsaB
MKPIVIAGEPSPAEREHLQAELGKRVRLLSPALSLRRPAALAELAWQRLVAGESDDLHSLEPFYLHLSNPAVT